MIWNTPGKNSSDSMTTGNGDIGINVWTDKKGDLLFYLGKTDSWDENSGLSLHDADNIIWYPHTISYGNCRGF